MFFGSFLSGEEGFYLALYDTSLIKFHLYSNDQIGDMLDEEDFEDGNDEYNGRYVRESISGDVTGNWPFPDPHQGLGKYLDEHSSMYMEEFDKWWNIVQENKKKIADWEFNRIIKVNEKTMGKSFQSKY